MNYVRKVFPLSLRVLSDLDRPLEFPLPIRFAQLPVCRNPSELAAAAAARQGPLQAGTPYVSASG